MTPFCSLYTIKPLFYMHQWDRQIIHLRNRALQQTNENHKSETKKAEKYVGDSGICPRREENN